MVETGEILRAEIDRLREAMEDAAFLAEQMGHKTPAQRCALIADLLRAALAKNYHLTFSPADR